MSDSEDFLLRINPSIFSDDQGKSKTLKKKKKASAKKMKVNKVIPNHFIAFKIYDSALRENVDRFLWRVIRKYPTLDKAVVDLKTLHVTLAVTRLENDEKKSELQKKLQEWCDNNMRMHFRQPIHVNFKGVGTFRKEVAYAKVNEGENHKRLCHLSAAINKLLADSGFYVDEREKYTPHLTLFKLSKNRKLYKGTIKKASDDIESLKEYDDDFGGQDVKEIQLLSMTERDKDGYYKCLWEAKTKDEPDK